MIVFKSMFTLGFTSVVEFSREFGGGCQNIAKFEYY